MAFWVASPSKVATPAADGPRKLPFVFCACEQFRLIAKQLAIMLI